MKLIELFSSELTSIPTYLSKPGTPSDSFTGLPTEYVTVIEAFSTVEFVTISNDKLALITSTVVV
jgi:hypothetical protein